MNYEELRQPICKAFTENPTFAGGAKEPVGLNFLTAVISFLATSTLYFIPVFIVLHYVIVKLTKDDPHFFTAFSEHISYQDYYES